METQPEKVYLAFVGPKLVSRGPLKDAVLAGKKQFDKDQNERIALFDDQTGRPIDIDFTGTELEVFDKLKFHTIVGDGSHITTAKKKPGRPKLGVTSREISMLPRHWRWLSTQRGGASATLRRLVDEARKGNNSEQDREREAIDAAHRFMWDIAGNQPGFENASRALFAKDFDKFLEQISSWPKDITNQLKCFVERI